MTFKCPICSSELQEYGTTGMTCAHGHQFLKADIEHDHAVYRPRGRKPVPAWVPTMALAASALALAIFDLVHG